MLSMDKDMNKDLKDIERTLSSSKDLVTQNMSIIFSYTKTNKLISALYMVTDMIEKEEPIRNKLRTLGAGIISDIHSTDTHAQACSKIYEIMSFLDVAQAINLISEMNSNILRKEFLDLNQSIKDSLNKVGVFNRQINLSEFFSRDVDKSIGHGISYKGHTRTRIGVQKGSTLMKALSDKVGSSGSKDFDLLKKERRDNIIKLIKTIGGNATIKDIKDKTKTSPDQAGTLITSSEKTLQRELVSMIKDNVLYKTGEKRWSRYFIKT